MNLLLQGDGKAVAMMMVNLLRLDAAFPMSKKYEMDIFRDDGPLAFTRKEQPAYSKLGIYILKEFWLKENVLPSISKYLCIKSASDVDTVMKRTFSE
jgi:hypothetical protein